MSQKVGNVCIFLTVLFATKKTDVFWNASDSEVVNLSSNFESARMSDEHGAADLNRPVPSEFPEVLGSQSFDDEDTKTVVAFIASLEVTRNVILRSVPAFKVLQGFGSVFRKTTAPHKLYALSRQCQSIEEFWSHSRSETREWFHFVKSKLGGGFKQFLFSPLPGKSIQFD